MTETHKRAIPSQIDDALKRPPPKTLWERADAGWEQLAKDVRHFRTLSTLQQIIVVLFITGITLVIMSVLIHWFGWIGWF
jgi:hypothetical protein